MMEADLQYLVRCPKEYRVDETGLPVSDRATLWLKVADDDDDNSVEKVLVHA